jgi:hypothetical protein
MLSKDEISAVFRILSLNSYDRVAWAETGHPPTNGGNQESALGIIEQSSQVSCSVTPKEMLGQRYIDYETSSLFFGLGEL